MKVADIRRELVDCSPEKREELLGGLVGAIYTFSELGRKEIGHGFEELQSIADRWYAGMVTKEAWLRYIENRLPFLDDEAEEIVVFLPEPYYIPKPRIEVVELELPDIHYEIADIEQPKQEHIPYRPKLYKYDKRRNFKPKNIWNRIRSRCK